MKTSGIPLSSLPPRLQAQVREQIAAGQPAKAMRIAADHAKEEILLGALTAKPRLRQSSKGPNKTEAAFAAYLRAQDPGNVVLEQAVTLVLANGLRYTPDAFRPAGSLHSALKPAFYEVKGFMRDDAAAKLKVAARVHSWAMFYLVTRRGRTCGGWDIQHILP